MPVWFSSDNTGFVNQHRKVNGGASPSTGSIFSLFIRYRDFDRKVALD